jgi:hypothetical protein
MSDVRSQKSEARKEVLSCALLTSDF